MEMIDVLPPGLYEAVITEVDESTVNPELVEGKYLFRLETRTLNDIRALGGNDAEDDARFATVARVSEINLGLYQTLVCSGGAQAGYRAGGRGDARGASQPAALRRVLRSESDDAASEGAGGSRSARRVSRSARTIHFWRWSGRLRPGSRPVCRPSANSATP